MDPGKPDRSARRVRSFDAHAFLESAGVAKTIVQYVRGETIEYDGRHPLKVNGSLLSVILHERA